MDQQNKFRGLNAQLKSRIFVKERRVPLSRQLRVGLSERLLDARAALDPSQYDTFIAWVYEYTNSQFADLLEAPRGYDELSGIYVRAPSVPLERELLWLASRFAAEAGRISAFRSGVEAIETAALHGYLEPAIEALSLLQTAFGVSLWSVQLRLALEQLAGGLERQKNYAAEVRGTFRRGLLGFTTYHSSVRNEDRTTLAKYLDDITSRIERSAVYEAPLKTYLRYRLAGMWPASEQGLADILRTEQSHSLLDCYESFVAVLQQLAARPCGESLREAIAASLAKLGAIKDFRLIKLVRMFGPPVALTPFDRSTRLSDLLLTGDVAGAVRCGLRSLRGNRRVDPWEAFYLGIALGHCDGKSNPKRTLIEEIVQGIGRIVARDGKLDDPVMQLGKLSLNLRGLPLGQALIDFLALIQRSESDASWEVWRIGMNAPSHGIEDCRAGAALPVGSGLTQQLWTRALDPVGAATPSSGESARPLFTALGLIQAGDFDTAVTLLDQTEVEAPPARTFRALLLLHALAGTGARARIVDLIADEGARGPAHRRALPVDQAMRHFSLADFLSAAAPLAPAIALHLLWRVDERPQIASLLRLVTVKVLRQAGSRKPSQLDPTEYPAHQYQYFLWQVCRPDVLDVSRVVHSSQEVKAERRAICERLVELDPANSDFADEIAQIDEEIAIDEGRWIVGTTRIHVDIEAFNRWARREIAEDFARYCDLIAVQLDKQQNFDDVLKELEANPAQRTQFTPENEADAVLVSMLRRLGDEFLTNPNFGLDFYLSKRIRHQSFIGLIRGPLEFSNLITTRESETGDYHVNAHWLAKFSTMPQASLEAIDRAIRIFAARFDDTLLAAKDHRFHIRSSEYPAGLLRITISPALIALVRALVRAEAGFEDFLATATAVFWAALEPSLAEARKLISEEIKSEITDGVDTLRASVRRIAESDPAFLEFDAEVGQQSTAVQQALDEAAGWFTHLDPEVYRRSFSLEQAVAIAVESALKCQRGFDPMLVKRIEGDLQLSASSMVFIHDVIFVALSNIHNHAGMREPRVELSVRWDEPQSTLRIEVSNEGRPSNRIEKAKNLGAIRDLIERREFSARTRREGGTGFLKLAAVVTQSDKGSINFDLAHDGNFKLEIVYSLSVRQELIDVQAA